MSRDMGSKDFKGEDSDPIPVYHFGSSELCDSVERRVAVQHIEARTVRKVFPESNEYSPDIYSIEVQSGQRCPACNHVLPGDPHLMATSHTYPFRN
jgi:hypothetical protein